MPSITLTTICSSSLALPQVVADLQRDRACHAVQLPADCSRLIRPVRRRYRAGSGPARAASGSTRMRTVRRLPPAMFTSLVWGMAGRPWRLPRRSPQLKIAVALRVGAPQHQHHYRHVVHLDRLDHPVAHHRRNTVEIGCSLL